MRDGDAICAELDGRRTNRAWEFVCPAHGSRKRKRSAYLYEDGRLWCFGCGGWRELAAALDDMGFRDDGRNTQTNPEEIARGKAERIADAQRRWADALDQPEYVAGYLKQRGITLAVPWVLRRWRNGFVAALQSRTDQITAVHFKNAARSETHGVMRGSAVKLAPPRDGAIGLAEGVENALSATALHNVPCWAVIGTRLDDVDLPADVTRVHLFPDNDGVPGRAAAERAKLAYLSEMIAVEIWWPDEGCDWNDMLLLRRGK